MGFKEHLINESGNYSVVLGDGKSENYELKNFKTPKEAILQWINYQSVDPKNVIIFTKDDKLKRDFYDYIFNNLEWFAKIVNQQKAYKPNYLYTEVQTINVEKTSKDALEPFTRG